MEHLPFNRAGRSCFQHQHERCLSYKAADGAVRSVAVAVVAIPLAVVVAVVALVFVIVALVVSIVMPVVAMLFAFVIALIDSARSVA